MAPFFWYSFTDPDPHPHHHHHHHHHHHYHHHYTAQAEMRNEGICPFEKDRDDSGGKNKEKWKRTRGNPSYSLQALLSFLSLFLRAFRGSAGSGSVAAAAQQKSVRTSLAFSCFRFFLFLGFFVSFCPLLAFCCCVLSKTHTHQITHLGKELCWSIYIQLSQRNQRNIISLPYIPLSVALPLSLRSFSRSRFALRARIASFALLVACIVSRNAPHTP